MASSSSTYLLLAVFLFTLAKNPARSQEVDLTSPYARVDALKVPSDDICGFLNTPLVQLTYCTVVAGVESALNSTGSSLLQCENSKQSLPDPALGQFGDARPLPNQFPNTAKLFSDEGSAQYWLLRMIYNLNSYSVCQLTNPSLNYLAPPGWSVVKIIPLSQGSFTPSTLPFSAILLNKTTRQLVILIRGTTSAYEWGLDFTYNQSTVPVLDGVSFPSPMHVGFTKAYQAVWKGGIQDALQEYVVDQSQPMSVYVAGHSLGAAVAQFVGFAAQTYLYDQLSKSAPVVSTVLFAPPNVGPPAFASAFNKLINGRRIAFKEDVVPQIPCTPSQKSCAGSPNGFPVPTNQPGDTKKWMYTPVGGNLPIMPSDMPQNVNAWGQLTTVPINKNAVPFLTASHICSYMCFTSQYASSTVSDNQCWLNQQPATASGSQCRGFPVNNYP